MSLALDSKALSRLQQFRDAMSRERRGVMENGMVSGPPARLRLALTTNSKGQVELDLGRRGLVVLPPEVLQLSRLQVLRLPYNELDSLPAAISYLRGLKVLQVSNNLLTTLPDTLVNCKHLAELDVTANRLQALPRQLGALTALRCLRLGENELEQLPHELGLLSSLLVLDLHQNKLWFLPFSVESLHRLSLLNLSGNLFDQVPIPVCRLASLSAINLSHNRLAVLPQDFQNLRSLTELNLSNNQFTVVSPQVLRLRRLKYLNLANNRLKVLPMQGDASHVCFGQSSLQLGQLRNLRVLHAHGNQLETLPDSFPQLQYLNLSHNCLAAFSVAAMPRLVCLNAAHNHLETPPLGLYGLRHLKFLRLENNSLRYVSEDIGKMGRLQTVDLSNNKLTSLPEAIYRLPNMHTFHIRGNTIDNRKTKATDTEVEAETQEDSGNTGAKGGNPKQDTSTLTSASRLFKSRSGASAHSKKIQTGREVKVRSRHQGTQVMRRRAWTMTEAERPRRGRERFSLANLFSSLRRRNSQRRRNREQMMLRSPRRRSSSTQTRASSPQSLQLDRRGSPTKSGTVASREHSLRPSRRLTKNPSHDTIRTKSSLRFEDEVDDDNDDDEAEEDEDDRRSSRRGGGGLRSQSHYDLRMARQSMRKAAPERLANGGPRSRVGGQRVPDSEVEYDTDEAQASFSEEADSHSTLSSPSQESLSETEEASQRYLLTSEIPTPVHSPPQSPQPGRQKAGNGRRTPFSKQPQGDGQEKEGEGLGGAGADYNLLGVCSQLESLLSQQLLKPVLNFNGSIGKKFSEKTIKETANGMWRLQTPVSGDRGRSSEFSLGINPTETFTITTHGGRYSSHHNPGLSVYVPPCAVADTVNASLKTITIPPSLLALARKRNRFVENIVSMGPIVLLATASRVQFNSPATLTIPAPARHRNCHLVVLSIRADNSCVPCTGALQLSRDTVTFNAWHFSGKVAVQTRAKCRYKACKSVELLLRAIATSSPHTHKL